MHRKGGEDASSTSDTNRRNEVQAWPDRGEAIVMSCLAPSPVRSTGMEWGVAIAMSCLAPSPVRSTEMEWGVAIVMSCLAPSPVRSTGEGWGEGYHFFTLPFPSTQACITFGFGTADLENV